MLGVIYGIERARVCELRNVDSDRPLSQVGRALWMKLETVIVLKKIISTPGRFLIYLHWVSGSAAWRQRHLSNY